MLRFTVDFSNLTLLETCALAAAVAALCVGLIAYAIARQRIAADARVHAAEITALEQSVVERDAQIVEARDKIDEQQAHLDSLAQQNSSQRSAATALQTELQLLKKSEAEREQNRQAEREQLKHEFENLAQKILEDKSERFTRQNLKNLGEVLTPLRDQMENFKKRVEDVYDKESRDRTRLASEIHQLKGLNERISQDAINLTNALKGESKTRGNWGEIILERILEQAGLEEGIGYSRERYLSDESGAGRRPDVIVHLPDKHDIVIDAKVSLAAYEEAASLEPGEARDAAEKRHVNAMRVHIKQLSEKNYHLLDGINTLDYVLMFVPIEPALHTAYSVSPEIFQEAYDKGIFIVSPTTLLMACRTVENIWRTDAQNRNAREISRQAGNLIDKFVGFLGDLDKVGKQIESAGLAYSEARKKLESGKGNLVDRARRLEKLGAKGQKQLPESESSTE